MFVCMRYWHPMSAAVAREVRAFAPDRIVLLPLYPQYSTTTTASSLADWRRAAKRAGLAAPEHVVCCYPNDSGFVEAVARQVRRTLEANPPRGPYRLLFSAHGLPKRVIAKGDPYQWQVELTVAAVVAGARRSGARPRRLLSEPRRAVAVDRALDGGRARPRGARQGGRRGDADRLRLRALGDPGRARHRVPQEGGRTRACRTTFASRPSPPTRPSSAAWRRWSRTRCRGRRAAPRHAAARGSARRRSPAARALARRDRVGEK